MKYVSENMEFMISQLDALMITFEEDKNTMVDDHLLFQDDEYCMCNDLQMK